MKRLAVLLSTFNRPGGLLAAARSVFEQQVPLELWVLDDGSMLHEQTEVIGGLLYNAPSHVAMNVLRPDRRYAAPLLEKHCPMAQLINRAIRYTNTEYVTFLCDDVIYLPERCAKMIDTLDRDHDVDLVFGTQRRWDMINMAPSTIWPPVDAVGAMTHEKIVEALQRTSIIDHSSFMARTTAARLAVWEENMDALPAQIVWGLADRIYLRRLVARGVRFGGIALVGEEHRAGGHDINAGVVERKSITRIMEEKLKSA